MLCTSAVPPYTVRACRGLTSGPICLLRCGADSGRRWCIFELWNAIKLGRDHCDIQIILAPEDKKAFHDRINADGSDAHAIDEALANVKSEEAEAFSQDDLDRIHTFIRSLPGGFTTLDSTIKNHLRRWFVSQGGVQVAARRGRAAERVKSHSSDRVERVHVDRVAVRTVGAPANDSGSGGGTAFTSAPTDTAGEPLVSMFVNNPAYNVQGEDENTRDLRDPLTAITMPQSPMTMCLASSSSAVGRSRPRNRRMSCGLLGPAPGATDGDVLPAASAGAFPSIDVSVGRHRRNGGVDDGYMEVEGTPPPIRLDSDVPLIADADVAIVTCRLASLTTEL